MLFNSYIFIFLFLPLTVIGYFGLNYLKQDKKAKLFLIGMSLWFYAYFELSYLWIILASICWNFIFHCLLTRGKGKKLLEIVGVSGNLALLFYFKYFDFLAENLNAVLHTNLSLMHLLFPLGISFFTFQQIGFLVDTARGEVQQTNLVDYALFVVFFPQLVAGPIVSATEILPQFADHRNRKFSKSNFYVGVNLFVMGLAKKVLLADPLGNSVNWGYRFHNVLYGFNSILVILFYSLQLYLDFSGYCDMARGIGKMLNINLPVNFLSPFKAVDILDFWDRWHISLSRFFTKYVYIPLGGNRKGELRTYINVLLVFLLSGFWHGANWTFVLWGCMHGVLSVFTRFYRKHVKKEPVPILSRILTFIFVAVAFAYFRADTVKQGTELLLSVFKFTDKNVFLELAMFFGTESKKCLVEFLGITYDIKYTYFFMAITAGISALLVWGCPSAKEMEEKYLPKLISSKIGILWACFLAVLTVWCIMSLAGISTFLYFNF